MFKRLSLQFFCLVITILLVNVAESAVHESDVYLSGSFENSTLQNRNIIKSLEETQVFEELDIILSAVLVGLAAIIPEVNVPISANRKKQINYKALSSFLSIARLPDIDAAIENWKNNSFLFLQKALTGKCEAEQLSSQLLDMLLSLSHESDCEDIFRVEYTDTACWAETWAPKEAKKHIGAIITLSLVNAWAKYRNAPKQLPMPCKTPVNHGLFDSSTLLEQSTLYGKFTSGNTLTVDGNCLGGISLGGNGLTIDGSSLKIHTGIITVSSLNLPCPLMF